MHFCIHLHVGIWLVLISVVANRPKFKAYGFIKILKVINAGCEEVHSILNAVYFFIQPIHNTRY